MLTECLCIAFQQIQQKIAVDNVSSDSLARRMMLPALSLPFLYISAQRVETHPDKSIINKGMVSQF